MKYEFLKMCYCGRKSHLDYNAPSGAIIGYGNTPSTFTTPSIILGNYNTGANSNYKNNTTVGFWNSISNSAKNVSLFGIHNSTSGN